MGIFRKQTVRTPWTTVLLVLLLALSIAASSIGFTAWAGAKKQTGMIEDQYTTIAVPKGQNFEKNSEWGEYIIEEGNYLYSDGTKYISPASAEATAKGSQYYLGSDNRILLSAYIPGSNTLSSGTVDPLRYNYTLDQYCYQLAVMALRCTSVRETDSFMGYGRYSAEFEIIDDVSRIDAYDLPPYEDTLRINSGIFTRDGTIPFVVGKTYLVRGRYWDYDIYDTGTEESGIIRKRDTSGLFKSRDILLDPEYPLVNNANHPNWRLEEKRLPDSELKYYCTPNDCLPYFTEYTGEWQDFLNTTEGQIWREQVIPYVEMNHQSVPVILTENLDSIYFFNTGDATIMEGVTFEESDHENGNAVCLISATYAKVNGLSVGDKINLDFYNGGYEQTNYPVLQGSGRTGLTIVRYPLSENTRIGVQQDYTIVGIYSAPEWESGSQSFHADTIFIPKSSIPNADKYRGTSITLLNSIILKNGSIDAFEAHMAANDKAGAYLYFDQGYSEAAATVQTLIDNAMRLMLVGVAMFLLASMLFLLLFARRVSAVMRSMRLLGVPKRKTWLESLAVLFAQELTAVALGNALAVVLYERITEQLLAGTPALDVQSILLCAGVQLGLLGLAGGIWMYNLSGRNLMQRSTKIRNTTKAAMSGA